MMSITGSPAISPRRSIAIATETRPAKASLRRSGTARSADIDGDVAVLVEPPDRHVVDDLGPPGASRTTVPLRAAHDLGHALRPARRRRARPGACPRHAPARRCAAASSDTSRRARPGADGPRRGRGRVRSVMTSIPCRTSMLMIRPTRLLVAGDGARREDHPVALRQRDLGMLVVGDAGERGARLAL